MASREDEITGKVHLVLKKFSMDSGTKISPHLTKIISTILIAIEVDPHPSWVVRKTELNYFVESYISAIPLFLSKVVAIQRSSKKEVTSFDFLHWFSESFNQEMCVIPKKMAKGNLPHVIGTVLPRRGSGLELLIPEIQVIKASSKKTKGNEGLLGPYQNR
ncbi:hypothetical protein PJI16_05710 [Nitrospira sp. MA-1]|nr:hypothetical protein [Nitrospira sp. MA-1]